MTEEEQSESFKRRNAYLEDGSFRKKKQGMSLVQRLQRERGATAAWVAGSNTVNLQVFLPCQCGTGSLVADLRRRTDKVAPGDLEPELRTLRKLADRVGSNPSECARAFCSTLTGYSKLIKDVSGRAFDKMTPMVLTVAKIKEYFAQQRGFIAGVGCLPDAALAALPPRMLVFFLQVQEELSLATLQAVHMARANGGKVDLEARLAVEDAAMDELSCWLRSDEFTLAALRARLQSGPISTEFVWTSWSAHIDKLQVSTCQGRG